MKGASYALLIALAVAANGALVKYTFNVEEWVVDFMRPVQGGVKKDQQRQTPFKMPEENRKNAIMVNGQYPGQPIECFEDDIVEVNVVNNLLSEATTIHWHGVSLVITALRL